MLSPFQNLSKTYRKKIFPMENYFEELCYSVEQITLLKQKGFYPYTYLSSFEKFRETRLPHRKMWSNILQGGEISVSKNQYNHAI